MKKLLSSAGVALLALTIGVVGCDDDTAVSPVAPPTPAPIFGTVSGTVSVEGSGLAGVSVNLAGAASQSASTGSSGGYSFDNVPAGTHSVQISGAPDEVTFASTTTVVTIATSGQTAAADFSGTYIRTSTITGSVTAGDEGVVATVTATGAGMVMSEQAVVGSSDTDGDFELAGLRAGTYHVEISEFPEGIEFPVTMRDVTVGVGLSANVSFDAPGEDGPTGTGLFIFVTGLTDDDSDDATASGRVTATIDVERGDFEKIALYVDGAEVVSQLFGLEPAPAEEPPLAAQQGVVFSLSFDSDEFDPVTGAVTYQNGTHTLVAGVTVQGSTEEAFSNRMEVEFANDDGVHVAVSSLGAGAMNSMTGQMWFGGPAAMIEITALPVLYSGGSAASVVIGEFCNADAGTDTEAPFVFTPTCKGTSDAGDNDMDPGDTPTFTIAGADVEILNGDDIFPLYLDFDGPSAPTFSPNPNGREDGWVNLAVDFLGEQKTSSNKNGWLSYNDDDTGVGGYNPLLRYAEVPSSGGGLDEALAAAPIQTLANLPGESKVDVYCAVVSAVDLLGNESDLPNAEDHATAKGTCMTAGMPSVEADDMADPVVARVDATGYTALLETAAAEVGDPDPEDGTAELLTEDDIAEAKTALANAGLRVGVDITPPAVEYTAGGPKDNDTELGEGWVLHVTDGGSGLLEEDPIVASIEVRDADGTEDVEESDQALLDDADAGEFVIEANTARTRFTTAVAADDPVDDADGFTEDGRVQGYYTFSATATDRAGNESVSGSRVALHDLNEPSPVRLFVVPGDDDFTYNKTLLASDNLSIASYTVTVRVEDIGDVTNAEIRLGSVDVDAYNASSLMDDLLERGPVTLPFLAVQDGTAEPEAIEGIRAHVSDQVRTAASPLATEGLNITVNAVDDLIGNTIFTAFAVTATDGGTGAGVAIIEDDEATIEIEATADVPDASTDFPFSRVDFYVKVPVTVETGTDTETDPAVENELRFIGSVAGNSATVKTLADEGRVWTYAAEVDAADFLAVVGEDDYATGMDDMGNVVAFGVGTEDDGKVAVAAVSEDIQVNER